MSRAECFVFAGPSLDPAARAGGCRFLEPAARGDIDTITRSEPPGSIVLADGKFHQSLSVGHVEIRRALEQGWRVWGVSSIGAIRAYELREAGMRGYGRVYRLFFRFRDFQDDEVAMLHGPGPGYAAASEPLVHMRFALHDLVRRHLLEQSKALAVLSELKALWYGQRTLHTFAGLVCAAGSPSKQSGIRARLARFDRYRVKQQDLASLLAARPWSCR